MHHYLKYWCNCSLSWDHAQLRLPDQLPAVETALRASDAARYYQNVCEYGYSFVWWDWPRWERHIDWMAINGLNLVLAETGQEVVWTRTFRRLGMTAKEAQAHFTGPAFLPWNRMGNLNGWGGPLPKSWMEAERVLQHKILERMTSLGILPVVPAFFGVVPRRMVELHPNASYTKLPVWGHFDDRYSGSSLVDLADPLAHRIFAAFHDEYEAEYGHVSHFYAADTFNEMAPPADSADYVRSYASNMHAMMAAGDDRAVWLMQGWLFLEAYWTEERARALLEAVPKGRMLVLDLASTTKWVIKTKSFEISF